MAKKKEAKEVVEGPSPAEVFANQRRIGVMSREDGMLVVSLLRGAGIRFGQRGNDHLTMITLAGGSFVIDLQK